MQVNVAKTRQVNHPLWNDASIADYDNCVRINGSKLGPELAIILDAVRYVTGD